MVLTLNLLPKVESKIVCYTADQIPQIWDLVKPHIKKALDRGAGFPIDDVHKGLCNSHMQLWTVQGDRLEAVIVTTIQTTDPGGKGCLLLACGGTNLDGWLKQFILLVEPWAKDQGCTEMRIYGRIGWARKTGYAIKYTKMTKQL